MKKQALSKALVIVGPTASGKTELSIVLARLCRGEIVSADSRQIFRYLDIGTAKPTPVERKLAPHHLVDQLMPDLDFSAGEFGLIARPIVETIFSKGHTPIITGGSGLYLRSLVDGLFEGKYKDLEVRLRLKRQSLTEGLDSLYKDLQRIDPVSSKHIHPNDAKRIVRALEVFLITGRTLSDVQSESPANSHFSNSWWGIRWPREILIERIEARVDRMVEAGLIQEVLKLKEMGYNANLNSLNSVGYKEVFAYLSGTVSRDEMVVLIKRNTRRFAKKQMTWFRADTRIRWIDLNSETEQDWEKIAKTILERER